MIEIIPSLPAQSFQELTTKVGKVRGLVDTFQVDVADGLFVTSRSWPMNDADKVQFSRLVKGEERLPYADEFDFEVHFMAHDPEKLLVEWLPVGIKRALFHIEARHDFSKLCSLASSSIELGAVLKIGTPVANLDEYIEHITVVQLMGIDEIGEQGRDFDARVIDMIEQVKERYPSVMIEVDGAVNAGTAPRLVQAGARRLAPGSFVLSADDPKTAIQTLQNIQHT